MSQETAKDIYERLTNTAPNIQLASLPTISPEDPQYQRQPPTPNTFPSLPSSLPHTRPNLLSPIEMRGVRSQAKISAPIPNEFMRRINEAADERGVTAGEVVRDALNQYFFLEDEQKAGSRLILRNKTGSYDLFGS